MSIWGKFVYELEFYHELTALQEIEDKGYSPQWSSYIRGHNQSGQFVVFAKKNEVDRILEHEPNS